MHQERAVADHGDARPVGSGELRAERAGDAEAHRAEAHRADQRIRALRLAELDEPVVVHADVAHEYCILRQHAVDLVRGALRIDRRGVRLEAGRDERFPLLAIAGDGIEPSARAARSPRARRSISASN